MVIDRRWQKDYAHVFPESGAQNADIMEELL